MRLIHQNMINATINAVKHPSGDLLVSQKRARFQDQIVKVEPAASFFGAIITCQKCAGKAVQGKRLLRRHQRKPGISRIFDPHHQTLERGHSIRDDLLRWFGRETADLGGKRFLCPGSRQQDILQNGQGGQAKIGDPLQDRSGLFVIPALCQQVWNDLVQQRCLTAKEYGTFDLRSSQSGGLIKQCQRLIRL